MPKNNNIRKEIEAANPLDMFNDNVGSTFLLGFEADRNAVQRPIQRGDILRNNGNEFNGIGKVPHIENLGVPQIPVPELEPPLRNDPIENFFAQRCEEREVINGLADVGINFALGGMQEMKKGGDPIVGGVNGAFDAANNNIQEMPMRFAECRANAIQEAEDFRNGKAPDCTIS